MSRLKFRNIDADPSDPVESWPVEGMIAALERGYLDDWRRIANAVMERPWGLATRRLESALSATQPYGTGALMLAILAQARSEAEQRERDEVAARVRQLIDRSEMTRAEFAAAIGTSTSRLSTYTTGKVAPSSTLMLRMEAVLELGDHQACSRPEVLPKM